MKQPYLYTFIFALTITLSGFSQSSNQQEKERAKFEKEMLKMQNDAISTFVQELETDAFVQEIVSQKLHSYSKKKQEIFKQGLREVQRTELVERLNDTHFTELSELTTPGVISKIKDFITMTPSERKKKEKANKKRDNN